MSAPRRPTGPLAPPPSGSGAEGLDEEESSVSLQLPAATGVLSPETVTWRAAPDAERGWFGDADAVGEEPSEGDGEPSAATAGEEPRAPLGVSGDEGEALPSMLFARLLRLATLVGLLAMLVLLYDALTTLPAFRVQELTLKSTGTHVTEERVRELLALDSSYVNLFLLSTSELKERLEGLDWVRAASVSRLPPSGLLVELEERVPHAVLVLNELRVIDEEGLPFARIEAYEAAGLPVVSGVPSDLFESESTLEVGRYLARLGLSVSRLYASSPLAALRPLSEVYIAETGYMELILQRTRVFLGRRDFEVDLERQLLRHFEDLERVLLELQRKGVDAQYVLLSADSTRAIVQETPLHIDEESGG